MKPQPAETIVPTALAGVFREMAKQHYPADVIEKIKDSVDCNLYFFENKVSIGAMYGILIGSIVLFIGIYILINYLKNRKGVRN